MENEKEKKKESLKWSMGSSLKEDIQELT